MAEFSVSDEQIEAFHRDGFFIARGLFNSEEIDKIRRFLERSQAMEENKFARDDGTGKMAYVSLWNHPGSDVTGMVARSERVVDTFEKLLGGEVYHYHGKVCMKEPKIGGAFIWHQDYGYWYDNGCLFPHMATMFVTVDKADKENGCLQVLKGSHHAGRVNHGPEGGQVQAINERVEQLKSVCPLVYAEMERGDTLFFHCNLLHRSDANLSERRRWALNIAYNKATNDPVIDHHHPRYTPLNKVPNSAILECPSDTDDADNKWFMGRKEDGDFRKTNLKEA